MGINLFNAFYMFLNCVKIKIGNLEINRRAHYAIQSDIIIFKHFINFKKNSHPFSSYS